MISSDHRDPNPGSLSSAQLRAIDILDAGGTHAESADAAGVSKDEVAGWTLFDGAFVAELNRRRLERHVPTPFGQFDWGIRLPHMVPKDFEGWEDIAFEDAALEMDIHDPHVRRQLERLEIAGRFTFEEEET
jgi:hypothetical protein